MTPRGRQLLSRELDGTLSEVERRELDRAALTSPELRRAREAWARTTSALSEAAKAQTPKLSLERMASQIVARPRPVKKHVLAFASFAMVAGLLFWRWPEPARSAEVASMSVGPVEIRVETKGENRGESFEDPEDPVDIRF